MVTLTGLSPPGGIEVTGGTVRIRFIEDAGTVTTEVTDPPAPCSTVNAASTNSQRAPR